MILAAALALAGSAGSLAPLDLTRPCLTGDAVVTDLLRRRLEERGAQSGACSATLQLVAAGFPRAEGFDIRRRGNALMIRARSRRGLVHAAGWILGELDGLALPFTGTIAQMPRMAVRGTQIGYRPKNNSYDAWTPAMLARQIEDLALWGANRIEIIAPRSDDAATSAVMPVPPGQAMVAMATAAHRLGMDVGLFYPLLGTYDSPAAERAETQSLAAVIAALPALDALYLPGGDPGHTAPERLLPLAKRLAQTLRARFPRAEVMISTQGFDAAALDTLFSALTRKPGWLTGLFVGPQTRISAADHVRRLAGRYPVELYPDTAHTMQAQLPIPDWHPAFALIEGREPVNPRPAAMRAAFTGMSPGTRGAISYSEGVSDDWNVHQWLALGWDPSVSDEAIARRYARTYFGTSDFGQVPFLLEATWHADPAASDRADSTLAVLDALKAAPWAGWRVALYRYRAVQDALVRSRWRSALARNAQARYVLRQAPAIGAEAAASGATYALARPESRRTFALLERLTMLADTLRASAGMQLSVSRHGASDWRRGANLDRAAITLDDRAAISAAIARALALADEAERTRALAAIGDPWGMSALVLHDDLGTPAEEPHLVRGAGEFADPQGWQSAMDGINDHSPDEGWPLAAITYAEALYEHPLSLRYTGLAADRGYRLCYLRGGEDYALPLVLTANGQRLAAPAIRTGNPQTVEIALPRDLTAGGTLDLVWQRPPGIGGGGRGRQIAEVWLVPEPSTFTCPQTGARQ